MSELCRDLHLLVNGMPCFAYPFNSHLLPLNGIYIMFEDGELAHGGNRIVHIGSHTGEDKLRSRLLEHYEIENKDRSIFRKHIGRAMLNRDHDPFIRQWELDLTPRIAREKYAHSIDTVKQKAVESAVTEYIQSRLRFVVICVPDKDRRMNLESKIISSVSTCGECHPSPHWLGSYSPKEKVRESGLWNINGLYNQPLSAYDLDCLRTFAQHPS
jgi:hypothetical protein